MMSVDGDVVFLYTLGRTSYDLIRMFSVPGEFFELEIELYLNLQLNHKLSFNSTRRTIVLKTFVANRKIYKK